MAPPGSGNLFYLDFIPHMDFRQPTETFEQVHWFHLQCYGLFPLLDSDSKPYGYIVLL